jgi:hypothetical protein
MRGLLRTAYVRRITVQYLTVLLYDGNAVHIDETYPIMSALKNISVLESIYLVDGSLRSPLRSYDERRRLFLGVIPLRLTIDSSQDGSLETLASSKLMDPKWTDWLEEYPRDCARSPGLIVLKVTYLGEGWVLLRS